MSQQHVVFLEANFWLLFICCLVVALLSGRVMWRQQSNFYTKGRVRQRFSILDLQFTSTPVELPKLLQGIDQLEDAEEGQRSKIALRRNLYIGFIYMVAVYLMIFLLCVKTALKMEPFGRNLFLVLAIGQVIPLLCDFLENIYLLVKAHNPTVPRRLVHRCYQGIVITKWAIAAIGTVAPLSALMYFWLVGDYDPDSLVYLIIALAITGLIGLVGGRKKKRKNLISNPKEQ